MSEVRFYHLQRATLEDVLPIILERVYARSDRALVLLGSADRAEALSAWLWTCRERSFLPHGTLRDGYVDRQPIFLTSEYANPNGANVLIQCDGAVWPKIEEFTLVCDLFDGNDEVAVSLARERWKSLRSGGHVLVYFQQNADGKWEESARA